MNSQLSYLPDRPFFLWWRRWLWRWLWLLLLLLTQLLGHKLRPDRFGFRFLEIFAMNSHFRLQLHHAVFSIVSASKSSSSSSSSPSSTRKRSSTFLRKKVHPGDLAGGFSDLEMTWLLYCAGAATESTVQRTDILKVSQSVSQSINQSISQSVNQSVS